jgi:hypothetical protein
MRCLGICVGEIGKNGFFILRRRQAAEEWFDHPADSN